MRVIAHASQDVGAPIRELCNNSSVPSLPAPIVQEGEAPAEPPSFGSSNTAKPTPYSPARQRNTRSSVIGSSAGFCAKNDRASAVVSCRAAMDELMSAEAVFKNSVSALDDATVETWESIKSDIVLGWQNLQSALAKAHQEKA